MREIAVVIRRDALGTARAVEGLRNAVGLTLADGNRVTAILLDDAALLAAGAEPERLGLAPAAKPVRTLLELGHAVWVERESLRERGDAAPVLPVAVKGREEIWSFLARCDVVVTW